MESTCASLTKITHVYTWLDVHTMLPRACAPRGKIRMACEISDHPDKYD